VTRLDGATSAAARSAKIATMRNAASRMRDNVERLRELGGLHGADIEEIVWRVTDKSITFVVKDMFSNFEGLPEYQGPKSGRVNLLGVKRVTCNSAPFEGVVRISGIDVAVQTAGVHVQIGLSEPGSDIRVLCDDVQLVVVP
jgi:hypothetical protein